MTRITIQMIHVLANADSSECIALVFQPAYPLGALYWGQAGNMHVESKRYSYSG